MGQLLYYIVESVLNFGLLNWHSGCSSEAMGTSQVNLGKKDPEP